MKDILEKVGHNDGMTVPEGYFESFAAKMEASLPKQEWESRPAGVAPRSIWQKVRPYVYLAAMFLGVWCMMNMFDLIRSSAGLGVENSAILAEAIGNDHFVSEYIFNENDMDEYFLMEDLYDQGYTPAELTEVATDSDTYTIEI
ncbi:MAG: hypothetical protein NC339_06935 [Muribaculaceae bacterium]|nr:hypothetical protein [Muribaculaceae bacterium]